MRITMVVAFLFSSSVLGMGCGDDEAPSLDTVDGVLARLPDRQVELTKVYCDCPAFLADLVGQLDIVFDRDVCVGEFSPSAETLESYDCLSRNFGDDPPEAVPGLACELDANSEAIACIERLSCGVRDAPEATECILDFDNRIDDCDLGSLSAGDPPDLLECLL
ncbi:MAG: hypothetical protein WBG86_11880 [Polyangiales bacterium]